MNSSPGDSPSLVRSLIGQRSSELGLLIAIVAVIAVTTAFSPAYREKPWQNAQEILRQTSLLGVFALGAAIVIISGGIDLSSGSVIAFSGSVCAAIMLALAPVDEAGNRITEHLGPGVFSAAIAGSLLVGFCIGTLHAWLICVVGLPPFVATLASLVGLRSLARVFVQAVTAALSNTGNPSQQIYVNDPAFSRLGTAWWIPLAVFLTLSFLAWLLMSRTVVGRHLYAMGGNEAAARLSGIRTDQLKWLSYSLASMTAAVAGVLYTAEVGTSSPQDQGKGYELNAIAASVVGGCSLQGGVGQIPGTMLGVVFLRVVIDSVAKIVTFGSADDYEGIIVGFLVVLAVAFNELRQARAGTRKQFFPGLLGIVAIVILSGLAGMLTTIMVSLRAGAAVFALALIGLALARFVERQATRRVSRG